MGVDLDSSVYMRFIDVYDWEFGKDGGAVREFFLTRCGFGKLVDRSYRRTIITVDPGVMKQDQETFIPALGASWATRFYDPLVRFTTREYPFKRALIASADLKNQQSILDLGCGTGTLSIGLKSRFPDSPVFAVDADKEVLGKAKRKAAAAGVNVEFSKEYSSQLSFPDSCFDRVFSTLLFHHLTLKEKRLTLREVRRVLKPGGFLHIADYGRPSNRRQKLCSNIIRIVDGIETTRDNFTGKLPVLIKNNGFTHVSEVSHFNTMLGTVRLFRASSPIPRTNL